MTARMERNLAAMAGITWDLLVIGGGVHGACIAWDAVSRGLSVALVEKADFAAATSANSLKTIHGGLRYLQHADLRRMRQSIRERRTWMQIAPHLVHPMPVLMPTYGHGIKGKELMGLALKINDLVSFDRNWLADPQKHIPPGRILSRQECLQLLPEIDPHNLTGAARFTDAQVYNSERLILALLRSAVAAGAQVANYAEVVGFVRDGERIAGVEVLDHCAGERVRLRARAVVNTAGPWVRRVLGLLVRRPAQPGPHLATAINLVTRPLFQTYAVGIASRSAYRDRDAIINTGNRLFFVAPWRGRSLVGTAYIAYDRDPDDFAIAEDAVQDFLRDVNQAYPAARLRPEDISFVHGGLVPIAGIDPKTGAVQLTKHFSIEDHRREGCAGLLSVVGVKYTTARHVAEKAVDRVFAILGQRPPPSPTATRRIYGGAIERFEAFLHAEMHTRPYGLSAETVRHLIYNYGAAYLEVLRYLEVDAGDHHALPEQRAVLRAEILHGIHAEMAQTLADVVLRRTDLGTAGYPGDAALGFCAEVMGNALGWSKARIHQEIHEVQRIFAAMGCYEHARATQLADPAVQQVGAEAAQV